jgi:hypothetical protein
MEKGPSEKKRALSSSRILRENLERDALLLYEAFPSCLTYCRCLLLSFLCSVDFLSMANKKKKVGSHKSKLKQQYLADLNERTVLALEAPSRTVHATVPSISNSNPCPPVVFHSELSKPIHHVPST